MRETINQIINGYINRKTNEEFKQNPMQQLISQTLKKSIVDTAHIDIEQYAVKCSAGQGNWAKIPWAGVFDRDITTTAQQGFYIVYLFVEDMGGVYLSLNQGCIIGTRKNCHIFHI